MGFKNNFVVLSNITDSYEKMNYVIYNPSKMSKEDSMKQLKAVVKNRFKYELSKKELQRLTSYDQYELDKFITDLRKILKIY